MTKHTQECEGYPGIAHDMETLRAINADLLAALEGMTAALERCDPQAAALMAGQARAAIAKAKGE